MEFSDKSTGNKTAESPVGENHIDHTVRKTLDESGLSTNIPVPGIAKIIVSSMLNSTYDYNLVILYTCQLFQSRSYIKVCFDVAFQYDSMCRIQINSFSCVIRCYFQIKENAQNWKILIPVLPTHQIVVISERGYLMIWLTFW